MRIFLYIFSNIVFLQVVFTQSFAGEKHRVVIGDTTCGGAGNPVYRELLNGWTY